jgi:hypothetical protein
MVPSVGMTGPQLRPLSVGETLDVAIKLYLRNFWKLMAIVAVVVIPMGILAILFSLSIIPEGSFMRDGQLYVINEADIESLLPLVIVTALLATLGSLLATGAAFKALGDAYMGNQPDVGGSIGYAGKRLHSFLWMSILVVVVIAAGFLLFIIPGIYIAVALSVVVPVLMMENVRGGKALYRSRDLVKGRWWPTFGILLLGYFLIPFIIGAIIGLLFNAVLLSDIESVSTNFIISGIGDTIVSLITTPLTAAVITVIYFDLRVRKEGFDLELLARDLGSQLPPGSAQQSAPAPTEPGGSPTGPPNYPPPSPGTGP